MQICWKWEWIHWECFTNEGHIVILMTRCLRSRCHNENWTMNNEHVLLTRKRIRCNSFGRVQIFSRTSGKIWSWRKPCKRDCKREETRARDSRPKLVQSSSLGILIESSSRWTYTRHKSHVCHCVSAVFGLFGQSNECACGKTNMEQYENIEWTQCLNCDEAHVILVTTQPNKLKSTTNNMHFVCVWRINANGQKSSYTWNGWWK